MARRYFHEFGIPAINGDAGDLLPPAKVFVSFAAELALAAGPVNPRHSNPIADFKVFDRRTFFDHYSGDFVAENQWRLDDLRKLRPVSIHDVHIGMANTAGLDPYQDFTGSGLRLADIFYRKRGFKFAQDGSLHAFPLTFPEKTSGCDIESGLDAAQEKFHRTLDAFPQLMGPGEI